VRVHQQKKDGTIYALESMGQAPVRTDGAPCEHPLRVMLGDDTLLLAYLQGGTLELCRDGRHLYLYCDTPGVKLELPLAGVGAMVACHGLDGVTATLQPLRQPFLWPSGAALLEIVLAEA